MRHHANMQHSEQKAIQHNDTQYYDTRMLNVVLLLLRWMSLW